MLTVYAYSEICDVVDPIDTEVDPDIKRSIRLEVVDAPFIANIEPQDGKMLNMGVAQADKKLLALSNRLLDKLVEKRKH